MKTSRADSGISHRLSIYGERSMQQDTAGKAAVRHPGRGVLKRLAAATSRVERGISRACRSASRTCTPLVARARYAVSSKASKFQAAMAKVASRKSLSPKSAGAPAQQMPAKRPAFFDGSQHATNHFNHFNAVNDIRALVTGFPAIDPDVPAAVGAVNALSKSLLEAGHGLDGVTYDQVTHFLERAQACDAPRLAGKARDFLLRAQSKAPEMLALGPYVSDPGRDREWSSKPAV